MTEEYDESTSLINRRPSRSFLDTPLGSFKGPNSLHNFASSFTRAQSFAASKIDNEIHKERSFFVREPTGDGAEDETFDPKLMVPSYRGERLSSVVHDLHRNQLFMNNDLDSALSPNNDVFYHDDVVNAINESRSRQGSDFFGSGIPMGKKILPQPSFSSFRSSISMATTTSQMTLKKIEDSDGNIITVLAGQSTVPQTVFNSVNVLIGVGLLALPVGIMKAGWVFGVPILVACGIITFWTATLLSKAMETDATIMTYADLGYAAYGSMAKLVISLLFSIDLVGAGVSLIILFSDSFVGVLSNDPTTTKIITFFILTPFTFIPLPILSVFSLLGILSTITITLLVIFCGLIKDTSPGSLIEVMPTNLWPETGKNFLLGVGILMAPFGGHAIFPNLRSDMRHPYKFTKSLRYTYIITLITDCSMGIFGFLMFGATCSNEVTNTLLQTVGYPSCIYPLIKSLICVIPLAKTPLNAKPIISSLDVLFGVSNQAETKSRAIFNSVNKFVIRVGVNAVFVFLAIVFPEFEKIIGILGASICFIICIILPCLFYTKLCGGKLSTLESGTIYFIILGSCVLGVMASWAVVTI
ncbi:Transmembrane amino acid transporter family protein [Candida parapsilosis]|uniref:Transmembrane amino acid transporter family protein n=1 Tax=Candida parapsilosis TaxID=5480 RepID=A0A8X7TB87_CANPA|nr:Transmembrane amino acid transporter family protein [Candida parapsilosis]KAF6046289.1 Transmembrane amino acid transporter family protein [Candida parapsilosis]KAF6051270.1 Transmembrane amino acid transporter family protein [Candida parapsilosis]KAF6062007.1 Transmembrane amino acid transporter family protein [Candida parapsilosis]